MLGVRCSKAPQRIDRVVKQVNVTYTYVLPVSDGWEQFPDMILNYTIKQAQYVKIGYHLAVKLGKCSQLGTRVIIDGQENTYFRSYTGNLYYHNHVVFVPVWTEPGQHQARIEVTHNGGFENMIYEDWNNALFSAEYYEY